jgi:hypothetical protein
MKQFFEVKQIDSPNIKEIFYGVKKKDIKPLTGISIIGDQEIPILSVSKDGEGKIKGIYTKRITAKVSRDNKFYLDFEKYHNLFVD